MRFGVPVVFLVERAEPVMMDKRVVREDNLISHSAYRKTDRIVIVASGVKILVQPSQRQQQIRPVYARIGGELQFFFPPVGIALIVSFRKFLDILHLRIGHVDLLVVAGGVADGYGHADFGVALHDGQKIVEPVRRRHDVVADVHNIFAFRQAVSAIDGFAYADIFFKADLFFCGASC